MKTGGNMIKKRGGMKRIAAGCMAMMLAVGGVTVYRKVSSGKSADETVVMSAQVQRGDVKTSISSSGTIEGVVASSIRLPEGIRIKKILVSEGDSVKKGTKIASVDKATVADVLLTVRDSIDSLEDSMDDLDDDELTDKNSDDYLKMLSYQGQVSDLEEIEDSLNKILDSGYVTSSQAGIIGSLNMSEGEVTGSGTQSETTSSSNTDSLTASAVNTYYSEIAQVTPMASGTMESSGTVTSESSKSGMLKVSQNSVDEEDAEETTADEVKNVKSSSNENTAAAKSSAAEESDTEENDSTGSSGQSDNDTQTSSSQKSSGNQSGTNSQNSSNQNTTNSQSSNQKSSGQNSSNNQNSSNQSTTNNQNSSNQNNSNQNTTNNQNSTNNQNAGNAQNGNKGSEGAPSMSGGGNSGSSGTSTADSATTETVGDITLVSVAELHSNTQVLVNVSVDESDIESVQTGQTATVTLTALSDQTFEGTVSDISSSADSESGSSVKYTVAILLDKEDGMREGMSASAVINVEEAKDTLTIPAAAVQERKGAAFVYTKKDDQGNLSGETEVTTGLSDGTNVQITEGLEEGDTVYYSVTLSDNNSDSKDRQKDGFGGNHEGMPGGGTPPSGGPGGNGGNGPSGGNNGSGGNR